MGTDGGGWMLMLCYRRSLAGGAGGEPLDPRARPEDPARSHPPPPSLPYKVDTSRPSLRTNWTRRCFSHLYLSAFSEPVKRLVSEVALPPLPSLLGRFMRF